MPTASASPARPGRLPPLRPDLGLFEGPPDATGRPTHVVHDPLSGAHHRLGRAAVALLAAWDAGTAEAVARRAGETLGEPVDVEDVAELARFLESHDLIVTDDPAARLARIRARRRGALARLLHGYVFWRVPLLAPDRLLDRLLVVFGFAFRPWFWVLVAVFAAIGLHLAARRADLLVADLARLATGDGLAEAGVALVLLKLVHEAGHGLAARRAGVAVPSMGVGFMMMVPVFYTDTTGVWRLADRRRRRTVALAGVAAETVVAVGALVLAGLLPSGGARDLALTLSVVSLATSLAVNLNPLMRFDGYFLAMDLTGIDNLQPRAFALTRWGLREALFAPGRPPPEQVSRARFAALVAYALAVAVYRVTVAVALALVVYHATFKALGVLLFAVEIAVFVALPVLRELREWIAMRSEIRLRPRLLLGPAVVAGLLAVVFVPWRSTVIVPAVAEAPRVGVLHARASGRVVESRLVPGARVEAGAALLVLADPALDAEARRLDAAERVVGLKRERLPASADALADRIVLDAEAERLAERRRALAAARADLVVRAPFAGRLADVDPGLAGDRHVAPALPLATLVADGAAVVRGLAEEADLARLAEGATGRFVPDDPVRPGFPLRLVALGAAAEPVVAPRALAAPFGGRLAARPTRDGEARAEVPVFAARFATEAPAPERLVTGVVRLEAAPESLAARFARRVAAVLLAESGL